MVSTWPHEFSIIQQARQDLAVKVSMKKSLLINITNFVFFYFFQVSQEMSPRSSRGLEASFILIHWYLFFFSFI